ncbi:glycerol-3-phosphate 1-O-acyltransferase PlsY [Thiococcus pfennigii]|uniref:glycerol-3-phosphate 1-O-acyltransferase PlsY n=1 Tax=Thiococcus pfennigii TaxID=1057 RepID=UPI00190467DB|nr:glycerol-3-phosphate 1-O-acyltransferase PlsY [Thiococcus pfennigii]MBK1702077.1 acyl-phosphate glycerol 3-phosphate acyltransferase [Thiococcus pfennigii]MBK1732225.1 acyl-phosphate glycerol 3-phosphate acyltransferase [Thiococcus pfennigii]
MITAILLVGAAYLLGSVSSAIVVCRLMGLPDPRTQGSNNPGATNVLRFGGKRAAAITLLGDSLKGLLPMLAGHLLGLGPTGLAAVGLAAFLGHLYPVFFGFQGGKGVATALGVQLGLYWPIGLSVAAIWLFVAKVLKISSLSALISMALAPLIVWIFWPEPALVGGQFLISLLLFWRHRTNIRNLLNGAEGRIQLDAEPED